MKTKAILASLVLLATLAGCASLEEHSYYYGLAKEHGFEFYFPADTASFTFDSLEEAYDYVNSAVVKLEDGIGKRPAKGLAARLNGPAVGEKGKATVCFILTAGGDKGSIDLAKVKGPLVDELKKAVTVSSAFLVFYGDRAVSISGYYIKDGYTYVNNCQYDHFDFQKNRYRTDYPIGWGLKKAFGYLRGEIE